MIANGLIAHGEVDERSIEDVTPNDVSGYAQCHFFAGIGGWSYALRLAGWSDDRPVWTGSCPCQPFSAAGKRKGTADERHLWPAFRWLISLGRPPVVFGEQVASKAGRNWLAGVRTDLEALGYGVGAADLCAASVGAPHIRQRLWWVAEQPESGCNSWLGDPDKPGSQGRVERGHGPDQWSAWSPSVAIPWSPSVAIPCVDGKARRIEPGLAPLVDGLPGRVGLLRGYGNAIVPQVAAAFIESYLN